MCRCVKLDRLCRGRGYADDDDGASDRGVPEQSIRCASDAMHHEAPTTTTATATAADAFVQPFSSASSDRCKFLPITNIQHGTIDPFDSLCVSNASYQTFDCLTHFASQIWTVFGSSDGKNDFQDLKLDAIRSACADKAVWSTFSYAGASHQAFLRSSADQSHGSNLDLVRLNLKQNAVQALIEATKSALKKDEIGEKLLSAMLTMASHSFGDIVKREPLAPIQGRKPQISISCAEYYDALELTTEHRNAFFTLLEKRGGVSTIENTGLRNAIIRFGIYTSYRLLEAPRFDRIQPLEGVFESLEQIPNVLGGRPVPGLARGFFDLFHGTDDELQTDVLLKITQALAAITRDQRSILSAEKRRNSCHIHDLLNADGWRELSESDPRVISALKMNLIWSRCVVMWELLSLVDHSQGVVNDPHPEEAILAYELCRIACLMYFQMWIWVISGAKINMARKLVSKILPLLAASLRPNATTGTALYRIHPQFFLWVVTLSVVMAYEDYDQTTDQATTESLLPYVKRLPARTRLDAWPVVAASLEKFLWSNKDCDSLGRDAWTFVCSYC